MRRQQTIKAACLPATLLSMLVFVYGCAAPATGINAKLDSQTGVTVSSSTEPLVLYRDEPGRAANAKSFLYLGPIRVNRSGDYQYFLWLGIWNTIQAASPADRQSQFDSVVLFVDGEPLLLDVSGWNQAAIGVSEPVYAKPVATSADAYYRVTADQIRLIAESSELRVRTAGPAPREFDLWDRQELAKSHLRKFIAEL